MGQKINPTSFRMGGVKNWQSRWFFPGKGEGMSEGRYPYAKFLKEDEALRLVVKQKIALAGIASIEIERTSNALRVLIKAARPGFVIGQGGKGIEELTKALEKALVTVRAGVKKEHLGKGKMNLSVNVEELKRTEISSAYVAQQIVWDLEKRMPFRRTMKKYVENIMQNRDAKGAKIMLAGRLDGAEIARHESMRKGELPLQTLRSDIDYATATAFTTFGTIGIKVWIAKGEVFEKTPEEEARNAQPSYRGAGTQGMGNDRYQGNRK
jgi:small subunit ribosomal protein S3